MTPPDAALLRLFFSRYWGAEGWRQERRPFTPEERVELSEAGLLLPDRAVAHDEAVAAARDAVARIHRREVAAAFVASLGSRRLDLRSALGSYAAGRNLPLHPYRGRHACEICGGSCDPPNVEDVSVLNFERWKWGGVRHGNPLYIELDLDLFSRSERPRPTAEDRGLLASLLDGLRALPPQARPRDAAAVLAPLIPSNDAERRGLIQVLGYAGILAPRSRSGFFREYTDHWDRNPPGSTNDWGYPISWWRGTDGVDEKAVAFWFAEMLDPVPRA